MIVDGATTALQRKWKFPQQHRKSFPPNHCAQYSYHPSYMPGFWYLHERILQHRGQSGYFKQTAGICAESVQSAWPF